MEHPIPIRSRQGTQHRIGQPARCRHKFTDTDLALPANPATLTLRIVRQAGSARALASGRRPVQRLTILRKNRRPTAGNRHHDPFSTPPNPERRSRGFETRGIDTGHCRRRPRLCRLPDSFQTGARRGIDAPVHALRNGHPALDISWRHAVASRRCRASRPYCDATPGRRRRPELPRSSPWDDAASLRCGWLHHRGLLGCPPTNRDAPLFDRSRCRPSTRRQERRHRASSSSSDPFFRGGEVPSGCRGGPGHRKQRRLHTSTPRGPEYRPGRVRGTGVHRGPAGNPRVLAPARIESALAQPAREDALCQRTSGVDPGAAGREGLREDPQVFEVTRRRRGRGRIHPPAFRGTNPSNVWGVSNWRDRAMPTASARLYCPWSTRVASTCASCFRKITALA